ncbi:hypothetical protein [Halopelagius fulvigenes]|uniref:Uncharacterized protein n=1 Tax=Halopelagius fulvigenes TaxID=1198324 RepID=A0ABD5TYT2_9EURY
MPELTISDDLYKQLETAADGGDIEQVLWEMAGMYRRQQNPESDDE